jgi:hypothetical protein
VVALRDGGTSARHLEAATEAQEGGSQGEVMNGFETSPAKPIDDLTLRNFGFKIESRPKKGPTLWSRDGKVVTQAMAVAMIEKELDDAIKQKG